MGHVYLDINSAIRSLFIIKIKSISLFIANKRKDIQNLSNLLRLLEFYNQHSSILGVQTGTL